MENVNNSKTDVVTSRVNTARSLLKRAAGSTETTVITPGKPVAPKKEVLAKPAVDTSATVEPTIPSSIESEISYELDPKVETKKEAVQEVTPTPENVVPQDVIGEDVDDTPIENFDEGAKKLIKRLRAKVRNTNEESKKHYEELSVLRKKSAEYEAGLAVPELTQKQQDRIAQLEVYEKLYNFKGSAVYQEKFVKPSTENENKLKQIAADYGVNEAVINQALSAKNVQELDNILAANFKNPISAIEAKGFIRNIQGIQAQAMEAEKEPAKMMARMQEENDTIIKERKMKANQVIVHTSKEAWTDSVIGLREDDRFSQITYKEGDTEHNEKFVRPILAKAAHEYGRTISALAEHGLTEIPKELAMKLARSDQLAHYSVVLKTQLDTANARVAELENLMKNKTSLNRPGLNRGMNSNSAPSTVGNARGVGAAAAGRAVLSRVSS